MKESNVISALSSFCGLLFETANAYNVCQHLHSLLFVFLNMKKRTEAVWFLCILWEGSTKSPDKASPLNFGDIKK